MLSNNYFLLRTSVRACCSSCLGFDDARWFEYVLVLYCKSFRFCRLLLLWSRPDVFSACCSRNDTCKPTRQSAKTAVTKIFDVGRPSITLWSWKVGGEMINPCIVHSAANLHYHEYSTYGSLLSNKCFRITTAHLYWPVCLWSGVFLGRDRDWWKRGIRGNNKMSPGKKWAVNKKNIMIWHHHISTLFSSTPVVRSLEGPQMSISKEPIHFLWRFFLILYYVLKLKQSENRNIVFVSARRTL